ncbi:MAG TPA: Flp family type IVb pilin [Afipia sp.]
MRTIERFLRDESAATAVEYALIVAGIALGIMGALSTLASSMSSKFSDLSAALK